MNYNEQTTIAAISTAMSNSGIGIVRMTGEDSVEIADRIYERHTLLSSWLTQLGVDPEIASEDACRMEHVISAESFEAIKAHISKYQQ